MYLNGSMCGGTFLKFLLMPVFIIPTFTTFTNRVYLYTRFFLGRHHYMSEILYVAHLYVCLETNITEYLTVPKLILKLCSDSYSCYLTIYCRYMYIRYKMYTYITSDIMELTIVGQEHLYLLSAQLCHF